MYRLAAPTIRRPGRPSPLFMIWVAGTQITHLPSPNMENRGGRAGGGGRGGGRRGTRGGGRGRRSAVVLPPGGSRLIVIHISRNQLLVSDFESNLRTGTGNSSRRPRQPGAARGPARVSPVRLRPQR